MVGYHYIQDHESAVSSSIVTAGSLGILYLQTKRTASYKDVVYYYKLTLNLLQL